MSPASRRCTYLFVEIELREWQLDRLSDLLFLHVETTNIGIRHVGLLVCAKHGNGRVGFRGQDVDEGIRMAM